MTAITEKEDLTLKFVSLFREVRESLLASSAEVVNRDRQKAFLNFTDQGIPSRNNENYKYTNLHPSFSFDYSVPGKSLINESFLNNMPSDHAFMQDNPVYTVLNGWFNGIDGSTDFLPEGVVLQSLQKIASENPGLTGKYYGSLADANEDPLVALNTAFACDGFFLYIPNNTVIEKPVQVANYMRSDSDAFVTTRNLIIIGANSQVNIIAEDHTLNKQRYLSNSLTEIIVGENSSVGYYTVQNLHNHATNLNSVFIRQERNSNLLTFNAMLHGGMVRNNMWLKLAGENANANVFGLSFPDQKQHADNFTFIEHASPHCMSNQLYKNVLDDESTGVFAGRIHVVRDAQKTNAFQRNNNLLLTDKASIHTKPQLIIDADDVKCSHGATVGQIDENALFYLRARGIPESVARHMLSNAFAFEVIKEIAVLPFRERIEELVDERLKGELAMRHETAFNQI